MVRTRVFVGRTTAGAGCTYENSSPDVLRGIGFFIQSASTVADVIG